MTNIQQSMIALALMLCMGLGADARHLFVQGKVSAAGKALSGVVVSDGYSCSVTDGEGRYRFEANDDARFVFVSTPSAYTVACDQATIPQFYHRIDRSAPDADYDFTLTPIKGNADRFAFLAQADIQVSADKELTKGYTADVTDMRRLADDLQRGGRNVFSIDLGDIVGNARWLYPQYIKTAAPLNMPIFRAIGNHDMEMPPSRTYEGRQRPSSATSDRSTTRSTVGRRISSSSTTASVLAATINTSATFPSRPSAGWSRISLMSRKAVWCLSPCIFRAAPPTSSFSTKATWNM